MGGSCFAKGRCSGRPALFVPRMPPSVYSALKTKTIFRLQEIFEDVAVPAEFPGKLSFGDIDLLVSGCKTPIDSIGAIDKLAKLLQHHLTAAWTEFHPSNPTISLAIPYETLGSELGHCSGDWSFPDSNEALAKVYIQVDVHVCPSASNFHFMLFHHGYGDACTILAVGLQPLGLTFVPSGLAVNLYHVARTVKGKPRRIILSDSVPDILDFLGLDIQIWRAGFVSKDDLFRWIISGRFLGHAKHHGGHFPKRPKRRPVVEEFISSWLPEHVKKLPKQRCNEESVLQEAITWFGKQAELDTILEEQAVLNKENHFWEVVRSVIPQEAKQGKRAMKGLRRWVEIAETDGGRGPVLRETPEMDQERQTWWTKDSNWTEDSLIEWVVKHWQDISSLERLREKEAEWLRRRSREEARG